MGWISRHRRWDPSPQPVQHLGDDLAGLIHGGGLLDPEAQFAVYGLPVNANWRWAGVRADWLAETTARANARTKAPKRDCILKLSLTDGDIVSVAQAARLRALTFWAPPAAQNFLRGSARRKHYA